MDNELQARVKLLDEQIESLKKLLKYLNDTSKWIHTCGMNGYWSNRDDQTNTTNEIHELEKMKARLITGEKLPEVIYKDREVIKYIDRVVKNVTIQKSSLLSGLAYLSFFVYAAIGIAYYFHLFRIVL